MLSVFPELLFLAPFSATLIRIAVAAVFAYDAYKNVQKDAVWKVLAALEGVVALLLFIGLYTQPTALAGFIVLTMLWYFELAGAKTISGITWALMAAMCFALVLTGAGALAFDLPL